VHFSSTDIQHVLKSSELLITKIEVPDHILDSNEIPQETAKQSLPNYTAQKRFQLFYDVSIVA